MAAPSKLQGKPLETRDVGSEEYFDIKPSESVLQYFVGWLGLLGYREIKQIFPPDGNLSPIIKTVVTHSNDLFSVSVLKKDGTVTPLRKYCHKKTWRMRVVRPNGVEIEINATQMMHTTVLVNPQDEESQSYPREYRALTRATSILRTYDEVRLLNPRTFPLPAGGPNIYSYIQATITPAGYATTKLMARVWDPKKTKITGFRRKWPVYVYHKGKAFWPHDSKIPLQSESEFLIDNQPIRGNRLIEIPVDTAASQVFSHTWQCMYKLGQWIQQKEELTAEAFYEKMRDQEIGIYDLITYCIGKLESGSKVGEVSYNNYRHYFTEILVLVEHYKAKAWKAMEELNRGVSASRRAALITNLALYQIKLKRYDQEGVKVHALVNGVIVCAEQRNGREESLTRRFEAFNWPKITQENQEYLRKIASLTTQ